VHRGVDIEREGTVRNGVIVLEGGEPLPDGLKVEIMVAPAEQQAGTSTLRERLLRLAGTVDDLPPDIARKHDRYIHGTPRR